MRTIGKFLWGLIDRIVCVVFAFLFSQIPGYQQRYVEVIQESATESGNTLREVQEQAEDNSLDVPAYLQLLSKSPDPELHERARLYRETFLRYKEFHTLDSTLALSNEWERPLVLVRTFDRQIHSATAYRAGFPSSLSASLFGIVGILLAWLLITGLRALFNRIFGSKRSTTSTEPTF